MNLYERQVISDKSNNFKSTLVEPQSEYEKYRVLQDQKYISSMDEMYKKYFEENKDK